MASIYDSITGGAGVTVCRNGGHKRVLRASLPTALALILISGLLCNENPLYAKSPKSKLKELGKRYQKIETLVADFREIFEWAHTGEKIQRSGKIILASEQRFRIDTEEQLMVCDNLAIYRYNRLKSQVIIEPIENNTENLLPRRMLLNFADEFKAVHYSELPVNGMSGFRLDMLPIDPDEMLISEAGLWVTAEDNIIRRLRFKDLNGNLTLYFLSNIEINQPIDSTLTTFQIPEEVEVFDLR